MDRTVVRIRRSPLRRVALAVLLIGVFVGTTAPPGAAEEPAPTEVSTTDWRSVTTGDNHSCGIRTSGRLYCWGLDDTGQLGDGLPLAQQSLPVEVAGGATNWASVDAGGSQTCARKTNGRLFCWGSDLHGQLGDGPPPGDQAAPVQVVGGATDWASVSAGRYHTCARKTDGRLFCWGADHSGQVGDGGPLGLVFALFVPVEVFGGATNWASVSAGQDHTCARRTTGRLFCWGADGSGQLGNGTPNNDEAVPVEVAGGLRTWSQVGAGGAHTCARRTSGRLFCWGDDASGQLGNGAAVTADLAAPHQVAGGFTDWRAVSAGGLHTCARRTMGRLACWGSDASGQLGDGLPLADQAAPVALAGTNWGGAISAGPWTHSCGLRATGRLFCWGVDGAGQLGNGPPNTGTTAPVPVG